MISSGVTSSCFQTMPEQHHQGLQIFSMSHHEEDQVPSSFSLEPSNNSSSSGPENHSTSLLYSLSVLKEKVRQAKSLVGILIAPPEPEPHPPPPPPHHQSQPSESTAIAVASMNNVIQDIIVTASSMMFTCQQMSIGASTPPGNNKPADDHDYARLSQQDYISIRSNNSTTGAPFGPTHDQTLDWFNESYNDCPTRDATTSNKISGNNYRQVQPKESPISTKNYDIIELEAADLLAKYTHYCQVCGKGFKRDANLRMHMRAHGDEYKTSVALTNPTKKTTNTNDGSTDGMHTECSTKLPRKYSCPQQGCRWNQKHAKFQPLKSMICVKNHYKRSHCPKMYVCKRCNRKHFSVLSDLRTHEKHCGDLRWQCSCGTTFSRKDKLMGHVALFTGHAPVVIGSLSSRVGKVDHQSHGYIPDANRN